MTTDSTADVLVLGAGPAGAAAAFFAVRRKLRVAIITREVPTAGSTHPEWLYADTLELLDRSDLAVKPFILGAIDRVEFVSPAKSSRASAPLATPVAVVDSAALTSRLLDDAVRGGAQLHTGCDISAIEAKEDSVALHAKDGVRGCGRLLIAADGRDSLAAHSFGLHRPDTGDRQGVCCQVVASVPSSAARRQTEAPGLLQWIMISDDLSGFGYVYRAGRGTVIGLVRPLSRSSGTAETREALVQAVAAWRTAGIVPPYLKIDQANVEIRSIPRGLALDMDTHVAKHGLVIGDAGGFVVAVSHEGLHPALMTGMLAAEICAKALESDYPQDVLSEFDTRWRVCLAEFLRLPNSDLRFLVPLIFTNERIAGRIANWLLCAKPARTSDAP